MSGSTAPPCNSAALKTTKGAPATAIPGRLAGLVSSAITPTDDGPRRTIGCGKSAGARAMSRPGPKISGSGDAAAQCAAAGH
jgi:hypothetical protein